MHSPAPWKIIRASEYTGDPNDTKIMAVRCAGDKNTIIYTDSGYFEPDEDDVALVVAAPDLLKACKRLLAYVEDLEFPTGADAAKEANAAIAKAERR